MTAASELVRLVHGGDSGVEGEVSILATEGELIATVTCAHVSEVSVRYADGRDDTLYF